MLLYLLGVSALCVRETLACRHRLEGEMEFFVQVYWVF